MGGEAIDWLAPSGVWAPDGQDFRSAGFFRPALLEFRSDDFMDDFLAAARAPQAEALRARLLPPPSGATPNKLFQPAHGCFYLVSASLCCRVPGFPDHEIQPSDQESVFFVLRKLVGGNEYGWVEGTDRRGWFPLEGQTRRLLDDEERLPLFPAAARGDRTLFAGYVPVSSSATYQVPAQELAGTTPVDLRIEELGARFTSPLTVPDGQSTSVIGATPAAQSLTVSVYLLLELYEYLDQYLPEVAAALRDGPPGSFRGPRAAQQSALVTFMDGLTLGGSVSLADAVGLAGRQRAALNQPGGATPASQGFSSNHDLRLHTPSLAELETLIERVREALPTDVPPVELPKLTQRSEGTADRYVVRCCYVRPLCAPTPEVISLPSAPFLLAPFFDPDAPARPIRIPLPTDVSIAGMRKFKKNVSFMMSDAMRKKMQSVLGNEKSLLGDSPSLSPEDSGGIAFVCSFSIQIIFIVAFFLLLIFVIVLNFVFFWIAFFRICFPIPKKLLPE